jgi:hypothetical protein
MAMKASQNAFDIRRTPDVRQIKRTTRDAILAKNASSSRRISRAVRHRCEVHGLATVEIAMRASKIAVAANRTKQ